MCVWFKRLPCRNFKNVAIQNVCGIMHLLKGCTMNKFWVLSDSKWVCEGVCEMCVCKMYLDVEVVGGMNTFFWELVCMVCLHLTQVTHTHWFSYGLDLALAVVDGSWELGGMHHVASSGGFVALRCNLPCLVGSLHGVPLQSSLLSPTLGLNNKCRGH